MTIWFLCTVILAVTLDASVALLITDLIDAEPGAALIISSGRQQKAGAAKAKMLFGGRIFLKLKEGDSTKGVIYDLVDADLVLVLTDGRRYPIDDIRMINYESAEELYPEDEGKVQSGVSTFILRDGGVVYGLVTGYSSTKERFWQLDDGTRISTNQIARIYFP